MLQACHSGLGSFLTYEEYRVKQRAIVSKENKVKTRNNLSLLFIKLPTPPLMYPGGCSMIERGIHTEGAVGEESPSNQGGNARNLLPWKLCSVASRSTTDGQPGFLLWLEPWSAH